MTCSGSNDDFLRRYYRGARDLTFTTTCDVMSARPCCATVAATRYSPGEGATNPIPGLPTKQLSVVSVWESPGPVTVTVVRQPARTSSSPANEFTCTVKFFFPVLSATYVLPSTRS